MNKSQALARWRTAAGHWAQFIKPSLFGSAREVTPMPPRMKFRDWDPGDSRTALVLDLPVGLGLAWAALLSHRGWCPVPMFAPTVAVDGAPECVKTQPLVALLLGGATLMPSAQAGAPVFVLDAHRRPFRWWFEFDNRSRVYVDDFPSPALFARRGINRLVVASLRDQLQPDLREVLSHYVGFELCLINPVTRSQQLFTSMDDLHGWPRRYLDYDIDGLYNPPRTHG